MLCVSAAALGSQASSAWEVGAAERVRPCLGPSSGTGPGDVQDPCPLPTPIYFRCLYAVLASTFQGAAVTHTPAICSLTASSCIFDKVIGIFLLTGSSLHFTCSFPGLTAGLGAVFLAWLPFPKATTRAGLTNSYLFCLLTSPSVVEGKADMRKGEGGLRRQCCGSRDQGDRREHARDRNDLQALGSPTQGPCLSTEAQHCPKASCPLPPAA